MTADELKPHERLHWHIIIIIIIFIEDNVLFNGLAALQLLIWATCRGLENGNSQRGLGAELCMGSGDETPQKLKYCSQKAPLFFVRKR